MVKCVVFDFDGTLVKSNEIKRRTFYEVTKNLVDADIVLDKILSSPDSGDRYDIFDTLIIELKLDREVFVSASKLSDSYTKICEYEISRAPEIKGVVKTIKELRSLGVKVFISSATPEITLQKIIDMRGWKEMIDMALGSPDSKTDHLQTILTENKYSISEVVYVGDSEIDRDSALLVGCRFVGIGKDWSRFSSKPSTLLNTLENFITELKL
jgi:phosphoglycolate phosphatase-like HAD superfamily hydrolase